MAGWRRWRQRILRMLVEDYGFTVELRRGNKCVARCSLPTGETIIWVTSKTPSDSRHAHRAALRDLKRQLEGCGLVFDTRQAPRLQPGGVGRQSAYTTLLNRLMAADADLARSPSLTSEPLPGEDSDDEILSAIGHEWDDNTVVSSLYGEDLVVGLERLARRLRAAVEAHRSGGLLYRELDVSLLGALNIAIGGDD